MRYLSPRFAIETLRRGVSIEQFLGPVNVDGTPGIRWATIEPDGERAIIREHAAQDVAH